MHQHRSGIDESLTTTKGHLDKLHTDIARTLEKIGSREKYLNAQLEPLLNEYRSLQVSFKIIIKKKNIINITQIYS